MNDFTCASTAPVLGPGAWTSIVTGPAGVRPPSVRVTPAIALMTVLELELPGDAVDLEFGVLAFLGGSSHFGQRPVGSVTLMNSPPVLPVARLDNTTVPPSSTAA